MEKFCWISMKTGELHENFRGVVRSVWSDIFSYHFFNLKWRYNPEGWNSENVSRLWG